MRSALYYPHTEIRSEGLLKTALMLWDEIHVISPYPEYQPHYSSPLAQRSFELIGKCHSPTDKEKKEVHELVEDFATRKLPEAFSYVSTIAPNEIYEVYPQKLLPETWGVLQQAGLVGAPLSNTDYPTAGPTGLSLMSLLADCCAGETLLRVTDRSAAYASLTGLLTESVETSLQIAQKREALMALALVVADAEQIPLDTWISLREREKGASDGHFVRDLRHRFIKHIEEQATVIAQSTATDATELKRQFKDDLQDDLKSLREALKLEAWQMIPTKEVLGTALAGAVASAALVTHGAFPMQDVVGCLGGTALIGGLLASRSKYVGARRKVLKEHPVAYLYEAGGGLRF